MSISSRNSGNQKIQTDAGAQSGPIPEPCSAHGRRFACPRSGPEEEERLVFTVLRLRCTRRSSHQKDEPVWPRHPAPGLRAEHGELERHRRAVRVPDEDVPLSGVPFDEFAKVGKEEVKGVGAEVARFGARPATCGTA